jgi:hypothetical protein
MLTKKMVLSSRRRFPKSVRRYGILKFFGNNVGTTDFDEWKRHRKIVAPAFSEVRGHLVTPFTLHGELPTTEKQKTRLRGVCESNFLVVWRGVVLGTRDCCGAFPSHYDAGWFGNVGVNWRKTLTHLPRRLS